VWRESFQKEKKNQCEVQKVVDMTMVTLETTLKSRCTGEKAERMKDTARAE